MFEIPNEVFRTWFVLWNVTELRLEIFIIAVVFQVFSDWEMTLCILVRSCGAWWAAGLLQCVTGRVTSCNFKITHWNHPFLNHQPSLQAVPLLATGMLSQNMALWRKTYSVSWRLGCGASLWKNSPAFPSSCRLPEKEGSNWRLAEVGVHTACPRSASGASLMLLRWPWYGGGGICIWFWELTMAFSGKCLRQRSSVMACPVMWIYGWIAGPSSNTEVQTLCYNFRLTLCVSLSYQWH